MFFPLSETIRIIKICFRWEGDLHLTVKFHETDLDIRSHSRDEKRCFIAEYDKPKFWRWNFI